jgi:hypothetical protein
MKKNLSFFFLSAKVAGVEDKRTTVLGNIGLVPAERTSGVFRDRRVPDGPEAGGCPNTLAASRR